MKNEELVLCRCGKPARRFLTASVGHKDADGHGHGSVNESVYCCHRVWCLIRALLTAAFNLTKSDTDRVRRHGHETDATFPHPTTEYGYD